MQMAAGSNPAAGIQRLARVVVSETEFRPSKTAMPDCVRAKPLNSSINSEAECLDDTQMVAGSSPASGILCQE